MRKCCLLLFVLFSFSSAAARPSPSGFAEAQARFDRLDLETKVTLQVLMTAAGYWVQIPRSDYSLQLFADIRHFQQDLGAQPTGIPTGADIEKLASLAIPNLKTWGFVEMPHPSRGRPIWVPAGIGGNIARQGNDVSFEGNGVEIRYKYLPTPDLEAAYDFMLAKMAREGQTILYHIMHNGFFVISARKNGLNGYLRYHQDGAGLLGFTMFWQNDGPPLYGTRIVTLVSASLAHQMLGTPMIAVPRFEESAPPKVARNFEPPRESPLPERRSNSSAGPAGPRVKLSSGSGVFVNRAGVVLTNNHVIKDCDSFRVFADQAPPAEARLIARDAINDLALLSTNLKPARTATLRPGVRLGETVAAFGYPHADVLSSSGNFTTGNVTALAGLEDDTRYVQISAPVQAGNSGGPLLDQSGNLIGIVTLKLNALKIAAASGDLPQNVNFALKSAIIAGFLESNRIKYDSTSSSAPLRPEDLADQAKSMSAFILCQ